MALNSVIVNQNQLLSGVVLHWPPSLHWLDEQFFDFCQANKELRIERTAEGEFEIMAPTGGETGRRNLALAAQLYFWAEQDGSGTSFDSSTGYKLPNGAIRSPDVSWVKKTKLAPLTREQKQRFLPLCPDFIIELRSPSDQLKTLQDKMQEYRDNGAELGWLIDPEQKRVYEYRMDSDVRVFENSQVLMGEGLLKGFELDLGKVWEWEF